MKNTTGSVIIVGINHTSARSGYYRTLDVEERVELQPGEELLDNNGTVVELGIPLPDSETFEGLVIEEAANGEFRPRLIPEDSELEPSRGLGWSDYQNEGKYWWRTAGPVVMFRTHSGSANDENGGLTVRLEDRVLKGAWAGNGESFHKTTGKEVVSGIVDGCYNFSTHVKAEWLRDRLPRGFVVDTGGPGAGHFTVQREVTPSEELALETA